MILKNAATDRLIRKIRIATKSLFPRTTISTGYSAWDVWTLWELFQQQDPAVVLAHVCHLISSPEFLMEILFTVYPKRLPGNNETNLYSLVYVSHKLKHFRNFFLTRNVSRAEIYVKMQREVIFQIFLVRRPYYQLLTFGNNSNCAIFFKQCRYVGFKNFVTKKS